MSTMAAVANKKADRDIIYLVGGYIRMISMMKYEAIPTDIINLCIKFYFLS